MWEEMASHVDARSRCGTEPIWRRKAKLKKVVVKLVYGADTWSLK
jgi:hypothetical protein